MARRHRAPQLAGGPSVTGERRTLAPYPSVATVNQSAWRIAFRELGRLAIRIAFLPLGLPGRYPPLLLTISPSCHFAV